jgi:hypothetical protein
MAAIEFTFKNVKAGLKCTGSVRLACGCTVKEEAVVKTEQAGRAVVTRLLITQTTFHVKECEK